MATSRRITKAHHGAKMEPHCLGLKSHPGRTGSDARLFLEAVFWVVRTGAPWRDLPPEFGNWSTVYRRFLDWMKAGVFERMFNGLSNALDLEVAMIDVTLVKVHRHGHGAKGGVWRRTPLV